MFELSLSNKNILRAILALATALAMASCAPYQARKLPLKHHSDGIASWYGPGFHGRKTASGERYNQRDLTAAHKTLPFGSTIQVTNMDNGKSVVVRINDRGPFVRGRVIDLSRAAAEKIGMMGTGTARVELASISSLEDGAESNETQAETEPGSPLKKRNSLASAKGPSVSEKPISRNGVVWVISQQPKEEGTNAEEDEALRDEPAAKPIETAMETGAAAPETADDEQF